jgi:competence protein ComEC
VQTYGMQLGSRVAKIPHHGSKTSSTPLFVQAVADSLEDTMAVVSVGASNQFGMPDEGVLSRWRQTSSVYTTSQSGAVWVRSNGEEVWLAQWQ